MANKFVDCDGHVMENTDEIIRLVGEPFKTTGHMNPRRVLPSLDRFHTPRLEERKPGTFDPSVGPEKWVQFLDKMGLEFSALFPTEGLAYGQVAFAPWAIAYAQAYNDWLAAKYLKYNSRLKGIALIPLQDVLVFGAHRLAPASRAEQGCDAHQDLAHMELAVRS